MIPFKKPSIAPNNDEEQDSFDELDEMLLNGDLSSTCGWAIQVKTVLEDREHFKLIKKGLRSFEGRSVLNWTYLLMCLKEVRNTKAHLVTYVLY